MGSPDVGDPQSQRKAAVIEGLLMWGRYPRAHVERIRKEAPALGLDVQKMVLGYLLDTIQDDGNSFVSYETDQDLIKASQQGALERLAWEIELPETPNDLREKLRTIREGISANDWTNQDSFLSDKAVWTKMRAELDVQRDTDLTLRSAYNHYFINRDLITLIKDSS